MWKNASWILHHDNALSVKRYLAKNNLPVMEHPPYSPDLAPCDFFLFPKIKSAVKGTRFESVDAVKAKATQLLNSLTQDDLQHCFQQWKIRMERCRDRGGDYIEGDNTSIVWFFFNKGLEHESSFFIATPRTHQTSFSYKFACHVLAYSQINLCIVADRKEKIYFLLTCCISVMIFVLRVKAQCVFQV